MGDAHDGAINSQIVAALQHEKLSLQTRLADAQLENQVLRKQLYHMSALLDIAVSKLGTMGVSMETPIDIRALRAEAVKHASAEADQRASFDAAALAVSATAGSEPSMSTSAQRRKRFQLRMQLREHTKAVQCCSFATGDDTLIVTGGFDRRLIIQNFFSGEKLWDMPGHDEVVSDVAWFDGTSTVLSASYDATVKLWDTQRMERTPLYRHEASGFVLSATPLHRGNVFACSDSRRRTYIVDVRSPKPISWWEHTSRVNSIAFDTSTGHMLMAHSDGHVSIWDLRRVRSGGGGPVSSASAVAPVAATAAAEDPTMAMATVNGGSSGLPAAVSSLQPTLGSAPEHAHNSSGRASLGQLLRPEVEAPMGLSSEPYTTPITTNMNAGRVTGSAAAPPSSPTPFPCVSRFTNEVSRSSVSFIAHYHTSDGSKRLLAVSDDNMVRVYRGNLNATTAGRSGGDLYHLRNVLPGVPTRGFPVRSGLWKGNRDKASVSVFLDDGERDAELPTRRLTECDLLVAGGPDNTAAVFDVSEENGSTIIDRLEGHRDRVTGAAVHHSDNRPIIATTSADSTVRIWVPTKT